MALRGKARAAVSAGDTATVLRILQEHAAAFPSVHADWREATSIWVLTRQGRLAEARARIARFAEAHPNDPRIEALRNAAAAVREVSAPATP
jgi:hypothetical protein